ncbi:MAG: sigma-70 family RNA polymerase sigma factor [Planctomycetota bacterium]
MPATTTTRTKQCEARSLRLERVMRTEVSFIPNAEFSGLKPTQIVDSSDLASEVAENDGGRVPQFTPGLPAHLARMCATPLLTHEEERELFRWMNYFKFRANALRSRLDRNPEKLDEAEACIAKGERLRNYLLQANIRLVLSIARKFADARNSFDDLLSQGIASLMHAVEKFDFDRGYRFSTYATCAVRRDLYRLVMSRKKDLQRYTTGSAEQLDSTADEREPLDPNAEAEWKMLSSAVGEMIGQLDDREQFIVRKRYGLEGSVKKVSYSSLGRELGISKERVRQLANRAMEKLRESAVDRRLDALLA